MSLYTQFDHTLPPLGPDGTPWEFFEALRDEAIATDTPIGWSEKHGGFWIATSYEACRDILHDTEHFSNLGNTFPAYAIGADGEVLMLAGQDDPAHQKYRRLVQGPFSPQKVASFQPALVQMTNGLIDRFIADGEVEVVRAFTDEIPARLTAIILRLDPEAGDLYRKWTWAMSHLFATDAALAAEHVAEMDAYFVDTLARRKRNLGDDVLSLVIQSEIDGEKLSDKEIRDFFVVLLLGGIDNTTKLLSTMFWRLGWDPEVRRRMARRKGSSMLVAMDEFTRHYPPAWLGRLIVKDVEIGGVKLEAGRHVVVHAPIANRDPRAFPAPDALFLDRSPNRHLGLGLGVHRCLGAHLVRMEASIAAEAFLARIPEFELDTGKPTRWVTGGQIFGMVDVNLVFPAGGGRRTDHPTLGSAMISDGPLAGRGEALR